MSENENLPAQDGPDHSLVPSPTQSDQEIAPGLPAHVWRPTDVDPKAEKRAERQVAGLFVFSMICAVLFVVVYFSFEIGREIDTFLGFGASNLFLGLTLGGSLLGIGVGIIQWARKLMTDVEIAELRHPAASSEDDRATTLKALSDGLEESGIGRRPLIRNTLLGALAFSGIPLIVALRDLGPRNMSHERLESTFWMSGMYVVRDVLGTRINKADLQIGDLVNAEPEGLVPNSEGHLPAPIGPDGQELRPALPHEELLIQKTKSAIILLRMSPNDIVRNPDRENWDVDGIVCYSKICTHVGCPIALNEQQTHHLLCPCHQSTFDLADSGKVIFGPAGHSLPQMHLAEDDEGFLYAMNDFDEPVGPSYWERG
ncbi:Rieske 2Fe-2S domain-containing protein [Nocardioides zeae]|uniref:Cytochrome bc1 complex Rieske iron-sulfur subunit n=1 Tax=Nocardioides imazamoxiresistens TaxID=3231893 RepID=A0ABU3PX84_9ACTN|nr:Rieske 2Fe-2S domain-containing protein [Nocardioides zeae]MDT9593809.1 Rieske 2Fe-2S domain-containing protein [Nocardioides zeae]